LRGASRPARRIPSITALYGSGADGRGGSGLRGSGQAELPAELGSGTDIGERSPKVTMLFD
jgi:hypothetical protein